jgi:hypothetical protein
LLTGLKKLFASVAMQAASAMGFNPASASAAAQETTVGARAAMHSVVLVSDVRFHQHAPLASPKRSFGQGLGDAVYSIVVCLSTLGSSRD